MRKSHQVVYLWLFSVIHELKLLNYTLATFSNISLERLSSSGTWMG